MKKTFTQTPVMPDKRPRDFNHWQLQIQQHLDKIKGTDVAKRLKK